jgi:hypothetical protein
MISPLMFKIDPKYPDRANVLQGTREMRGRVVSKPVRILASRADPHKTIIFIDGIENSFPAAAGMEAKKSCPAV